jgi:hypothetical protein
MFRYSVLVFDVFLAKCQKHIKNSGFILTKLKETCLSKKNLIFFKNVLNLSEYFVKMLLKSCQIFGQKTVRILSKPV